jgi:hypothetical protein
MARSLPFINGYKSVTSRYIILPLFWFVKGFLPICPKHFLVILPAPASALGGRAHPDKNRLPKGKKYFIMKENNEKGYYLHSCPPAAAMALAVV